MLCIAALSLAVLGGLVALVAGFGAATTRWLAVLDGLVVVVGIALGVRTEGAGTVVALGGALRADALSSFMVIVIGTVALLAVLQTNRVITHELELGEVTPARAGHYVVLVQVFIACMLLAVLASNLGILWVAIEATTIATTFLVAHRRTDAALEASWKYVVLCSVGIALAFLGTVLFYFADAHGVGAAHASLDWSRLMADSSRMDPGVTRLALALLVLGYGTKVGLAPMHSWLPDAHSQAPAPVSALMSGVLLAVAFYALLRWRAVAEGALGPNFPRVLFAVAGLASLGVAAALIVTQRDLKRLLAYSSVEHMGLLALAAAAGSTLAIAAALLHILGHGLAKSTAFLASGEVHHAEGTTKIAEVRTLLARRPAVGALLGVSLLALLGFPPFSLFASEFAMARAEVTAGMWWAVAVALVCLTVVFAGVARHARGLLLGPAARAGDHIVPRSLVVPLAGALAVCAVLGLVAWPLQSLLLDAARTVTR